MISYYILFSVVFGLGIIPVPKTIKIILIILVLVLFAGTRYYIDNDFIAYQEIFQNPMPSYSAFKNSFNYEIQMFLISNFFGFFIYDVYVLSNICFVFFALLGVVLKISAISKLTPYFLYSVLLYFTNIYFAQEMTSIRAGISSGIFLWIIYYFIQGKYKHTLFLIAVSFTFHTSSAFFILALFLVYMKLRIKYYYYILVLSFVISMLGINLVEILRLELFFSRIQTYNEMMTWQNETLNIFNFKVLISMVFVLLFGLQYEKIKDNPLIDTLFKVHIFSLAVFYALSLSSPTFSLRAFELLSVVQIILYPFYISLLARKIRFAAVILVVFVIVLQFIYFAEFSNLLRPYQSWYL